MFVRGKRIGGEWMGLDQMVAFRGREQGEAEEGRGGEWGEVGLWGGRQAWRIARELPPVVRTLPSLKSPDTLTANILIRPFPFSSPYTRLLSALATLGSLRPCECEICRLACVWTARLIGRHRRGLALPSGGQSSFPCHALLRSTRRPTHIPPAWPNKPETTLSPSVRLRWPIRSRVRIGLARARPGRSTCPTRRHTRAARSVVTSTACAQGQHRIISPPPLLHPLIRAAHVTVLVCAHTCITD